MIRSFLYAILAAFLGNVLPIMGMEGPVSGIQAPKPPMPSESSTPKKRVPNIAKWKDVKEINPGTKLKTDTVPNKSQKELSAQKPADKKKEESSTVSKDIDVDKDTPPVVQRSLTKEKTVVIDARRLDGETLTDTLRYIKENPDVRLKLINMSINPEFAVKILKIFKDEKVIDQFRVIGFVMLPGGDENLILNEKGFTEKILPYLTHVEEIELSCLGITDKALESISNPKKLPHLKSIALFGVGITDRTITNLAKNMPNLVKIHLINTSVTSKSVPLFVKEFPYLRDFGISGQHFKDKDYLALKEGAANFLSFSAVGQKFENMNTVKELLKAMPKLHTLNLSESNVTDEIAQAIGEEAKRLRSLNISETQISFGGIKDIINKRDLIKLKMNNLKAIGDDELKAIIERQPGLKVFHFSGAYFTNATLVTLFHNLRKLTDVTLIPAKESTWKLEGGITQTIIIKKSKLQYLHIQPDKLPEELSRKLKKALPKLRIEFER